VFPWELTEGPSLWGLVQNKFILMLFLFKIPLAFVLIHQFPRPKIAYCALFLDLCFAQLSTTATRIGTNAFWSQQPRKKLF